MHLLSIFKREQFTEGAIREFSNVQRLFQISDQLLSLSLRHALISIFLYDSLCLSFFAGRLHTHTHTQGMRMSTARTKLDRKV